MNLEISKIAAAISSIIAAKITVIMSGKGGVLKTTILQNVAAAMAAKGKKVLIVDLDPQKTGYLWSLLRNGSISKETQVLTEKLTELKQQQAETGKVFNRRVAASLAVNAKKLSNKKKLTVIHMDINNVDWKAIEAYRAEYDEILFDTPGHSEFISVLKDLIKLADTVLVPFHNSIDDFNVRRDVEKTIKSCGDIKAKVYSVVTSMNEKQSNNGIPEKLLADVAQTMPIAPVKLYKRNSWLEVKYKGLGVVEASKDKVAKAQFEALADLIINEQIAEQAA